MTHGMKLRALATIAVSATVACGSSGTAKPRFERSVSLELLWSVGEGEGEENLVCTTDTMLAANSSQDRFYVAPTCIRGQVAALDSNGTLTGFIGTSGQGPAELNWVGGIFVDLDDQLHVFQLPRRHTVFDTDNGEEIMRFELLPFPGWVSFLEGGKSIRNLQLRSPDRVGKTLHLVDDKTDVVLQSFDGTESESSATSNGRNLFRSVASETGATFWSARPFEYVLEEWDFSGQRLRTIRRQPEWWVTKPDTNGTWLRDIVFREGLLWVISLVPTFDGDALPAGVGADPELNDYYDTLIEVIDIDTEEVVAQLRRNEGFNRWVGNLVFSHRDVGNGGVAMDVWRVHLSEPGGS